MATFRRTLVSLFLILSLTASSLNAAMIVGGAGLLTAQDASQIESWLGAGDLTLTSLFTKNASSNSFSFHAAVDFKGPTVSVIEVISGTNQGQDNIGFNVSTPLTRQVIGGYNPQNWHSFGGYNLSNSGAFIFNLATGVVQQQNSDPFYGQYQTFNRDTNGPSFGTSDIRVSSTLSDGISGTSSYGAGPTTQNILKEFGNQGSYSIGRLEVYSVQVTAVPEPMSWGAVALAIGTCMKCRIGSKKLKWQVN